MFLFIPEAHSGVNNYFRTLDNPGARRVDCSTGEVWVLDATGVLVVLVADIGAASVTAMPSPVCAPERLGTAFAFEESENVRAIDETTPSPVPFV